MHCRGSAHQHYVGCCCEGQSGDLPCRCSAVGRAEVRLAREQGGEEEGGSTCWGLHGPCVGAGDGWLAGFCPQRSYCIAVTGRGQENQSERMVTGSAVGLADGDQGSGARKSERLQPTVVRHPCASRCHLRRQEDL